MKPKEAFSVFLKGLFMGMADIIPGVSGGTIALVTGIYERLVHSISRVEPHFIVHFLKGDMKKGMGSVRKIDFELFIPLLLGIGIAVWLMSNVISFMLKSHPVPSFSFFFGLILASAIIIYKTAGRLTPKKLAISVAGFVFAFILSGVNGIEMGHSLPVIFASGAAAICAMILPGISGALILLLIGQYEFMLNALRGFQIPEIAAFCIGALLGIIVFSRLLSRLLKKYRSYTMFFLTGLMVGALRVPYENIMVDIGSPIPVIISAAIGFVVVFGIERPAKKPVQKTLHEIME